MTTEKDFQDMLDADPFDHNTRLVLAEWLMEYNDPRAEGYAALAFNRIVPYRGRPREGYIDNKIPGWSLWGGGGAYWELNRNEEGKSGNIPNEWRDLLEPTGHYLNDIDGNANVESLGFWKPTRKECEDCAALAFNKLNAEYKRKLLNPQTLVVL